MAAVNKKSTNIVLGLLVAVAGGCCACSPPQYKRCVDQDWAVVDEEQCQPGHPRHNPAVHRWYYGGKGYSAGERVYGGGLIPLAGVRYSSPSRSHSVSRGGFGRSASVHGGGGIS